MRFETSSVVAFGDAINTLQRVWPTPTTRRVYVEGTKCSIDFTLRMNDGEKARAQAIAEEASRLIRSPVTIDGEIRIWRDRYESFSVQANQAGGAA